MATFGKRTCKPRLGCARFLDHVRFVGNDHHLDALLLPLQCFGVPLLPELHVFHRLLIRDEVNLATPIVVEVFFELLFPGF